MIPSVIHTISDLRFKTKDVLASAMKEPVALFHRSTPKGVLMSVEKYQELMDSLEDYYLSIRAEEYEKEDKSKVKWISHSEMKKRYGI
ncbi:type II toxin-antitoxin system prevent-host-death family antitoxin [Candidatus Gottesmanbacteria bacterium]|nr:type II toxin-antitoxin system prevent-host-death family antitoxin [Candidatus Gottesmanbacteria bacterium]